MAELSPPSEIEATGPFGEVKLVSIGLRDAASAQFLSVLKTIITSSPTN